MYLFYFSLIRCWFSLSSKMEGLFFIFIIAQIEKGHLQVAGGLFHFHRTVTAYFITIRSWRIFSVSFK